MKWREEFESLVRTIGTATYGKERWFYEDGIWYDRKDGKHININELHKRILNAIKEETE
jgi:hypothetical protein